MVPSTINHIHPIFPSPSCPLYTNSSSSPFASPQPVLRASALPLWWCCTQTSARVPGCSGTPAWGSAATRGAWGVPGAEVGMGQSTQTPCPPAWSQPSWSRPANTASPRTTSWTSTERPLYTIARWVRSSGVTEGLVSHWEVSQVICGSFVFFLILSFFSFLFLVYGTTVKLVRSSLGDWLTC